VGKLRPLRKVDIPAATLRVIAEDTPCTEHQRELAPGVRRRAGANKSCSNCSLKKPAAPRLAPSTEMAPDKGQRR